MTRWTALCCLLSFACTDAGSGSADSSPDAASPSGAGGEGNGGAAGDSSGNGGDDPAPTDPGGGSNGLGGSGPSNGGDGPSSGGSGPVGGAGGSSDGGSGEGGSSEGGSSEGGSSDGGNDGGASEGGSSDGGTGDAGTGVDGGGGTGSGGEDASVGGATPDGGSAGDGDASTGGAGGDASSGSDDMTMTFFVTSRGMGDGGALGGLAGADAFCLELATEVDPSLANKTWRAYLSTSDEDARDRIGSGPWRNAELVIVANDVEELHQQEEGEALDATWPPDDIQIALDENGEPLENAVHDVLTGTNVDGTWATDLDCAGWTSNSSSDEGRVGHTNRSGGGRPPYFNATHEVGCAEGTENYDSGTVTQGGGRGSFYCFAAD